MAAGDRHLKGNIGFNSNLLADGGALVGTAGVSRYAAPADHVHPAFSMSKTQAFDLDNGAGTTVDELLFVAPVNLVLLHGRIAYSGATTGTVAGANIKVGTTPGAVDIVASTAYENAKAVGTTTSLAFADATIDAGTPVWVRHTGVAATQAGFAQVQIAWAPA